MIYDNLQDCDLSITVDINVFAQSISKKSEYKVYHISWVLKPSIVGLHLSTQL